MPRSMRLLSTWWISPFYSICDCCPTSWKTVRSGRQSSNINVERHETVLNVEIPENLHQLFNKKRPPDISFSHVLEVHSMSWPDRHFNHVQLFVILQDYKR